MSRDHQNSNASGALVPQEAPKAGRKQRIRYTFGGVGFTSKQAIQEYRQRAFPESGHDLVVIDPVLLEIAATHPLVSRGDIERPDALSFRRGDAHWWGADKSVYQSHMRCAGVWHTVSMVALIDNLGRSEDDQFKAKLTTWLREVTALELEDRFDPVCARCGAPSEDIDHVDPLFVDIRNHALTLVSEEDRRTWFGWSKAAGMRFGPSVHHPIFTYVLQMATEGQIQCLCQSCHRRVTQARRENA